MGNKHEPAKHELGNKPLVHITTAPNEVVAQMWAQILEDDGIHCLIKRGTVTSDFFSLLTNTGVPAEIHVLSSQAQEAKEILDSLEESSTDID